MKSNPKYILLINIHGLIRSHELELGRDADTGGQTKYVLEFAKTLSKHPEVEQVDLMTRRIADPQVSEDYNKIIEPLNSKARIVRIDCGPKEYIPKENLWDYLDNFVDNALIFLKEQNNLPGIIHAHYADAGYVGTRLSHQLELPLVFTAHSLGRSKRKRLIAGGMKSADIEKRYNMARRINAEEDTLGSAELVITSTSNEINEQYASYHFYQPDSMQMIPPGTDLEKFHPPVGDELDSPIFKEISKFLINPDKPMILALSRPDQRKNIHTLIATYGKSMELQELANLVVVAGTRKDIRDLDTGAQEVLTDLLLTIDQYDLYGKVAYPKTHKPDEVPVLYRLASVSGGVFINPALTEPFGLTLIEAAASFVPIVATEDGGPIDIVRNCLNGYLINPLDKNDIVDKILRILKDKKHRHNLSENGLKGVNSNYTWESHTDKYLNAIQPIIEKRKPLKRLPVTRRQMIYHNGAIVSDIDQNLLGDMDSLTRLNQVLSGHRKDISFCIATGRRLDSALTILKKYQIIQPDVLITSMGTEIYYGGNLERDRVWTNHIDHLWNRNAVHRILSDLTGLKLQPKAEQSQHKISYYYDPKLAPSLDDIKTLLYQNEQAVNLIYSFGQFLDIIPIRASKGYAIRWFSEQWDIALDHMLTAGGSGADEDMMRGNTLSVVVKNRHKEELSNLTDIEPIYFSEEKFAAGILDGIDYYDFFSRCEK